MEKKIFVRCLKRDAKLVKSVLSDAVSMFKDVVKEQLEEDVELELLIDEDRHLIERKIADLSEVPLKELGDEHEDMIKVKKHEDDQKW